MRILKSKWQNNNIMSVNIIIIYHYHGAGRPSRTTFLCSTKLSELHIIHWRILHFYSWVWQSYLSDVVYIHRLTSLSIQTSILRDSFWRTWNFFYIEMKFYRLLWGSTSSTLSLSEMRPKLLLSIYLYIYEYIISALYISNQW